MQLLYTLIAIKSFKNEKFLLLFAITKALIIMKKNSGKTLRLDKIKIASLSKPFQQLVYGASTVPACQTTAHQSNPRIPFAVCKTEICQLKQ
jgi:hypothetical protein